MKRYAKRLMALILFLCMGVFIGMEMTQAGIERVQGPFVDSLAERSMAEKPDETSAAEILQEKSKKEEELALQDKELEELEQKIKELREQRRKAGSEAWDEETVAELAKELQAKQNQLTLQAAEDAPVNKLADQTAGLLQHLSETGIKAVVGMFGGLF
ncbi:hypothetical protein [Paenibacillus sp. 1001270B_150601_E10]|uniref:hypothetical protein n=1 Tax=Paenibacillus sp. 1001270B_150601_E10 TaxID=2787079 RepID=UPI00189C9E4C|nr:hypothetical protein [Paenibacillus sp. 1001270B_150601_E10]